MQENDDDLDWEDDEDEDILDDPPSPEPEPGQEQEVLPETPQAPAVEQNPGDDLDKLRQKVRSAEGRYQKFGSDIEQMRSELESRESQQPVEEVADTAPVLPEGWTDRDWEDFVADSPVEAELMQAQNERLATLQTRLDTAEQEKSQRDQLQHFRNVVLGAHPDYEQLMQGEGEQVKRFIETQANPLVKTAYQQVYQQGTAQEVAELVTQYKLSRGSKGEQRQNRVNSSLAVPSRAPVPDASRYGGLPPEDDEDAAWDYFSDEGI